MQFLRALIFSAVIYASASFAATIPHGEEDVEITIKMHPVAKGGDVGFSGPKQTLSSLMDIGPLDCAQFRCMSDADCPAFCSGCNMDTHRCLPFSK